MTVFFITLAIMLAAVAAMAVGHFFGRSGIRGGCGSLSGVDGGEACALCSKPCEKRQRQLRRERDPASD